MLDIQTSCATGLQIAAVCRVRGIEHMQTACSVTPTNFTLHPQAFRGLLQVTDSSHSSSQSQEVSVRA